MNEKISVILPVYNVKLYLDRCLKSITSQSYKNIEVILVDDGSADSSGEMCDAIAAKDSRVSVIHQKNRGVSAARNSGLSAATGDAVIFLDPDDAIEPDMISEMASRLFEDDVDVVCCGYTKESDDEILTNMPKEGEITRDECLAGIFHDEIFSAVWNKMFRRRSLIDDDGQFVDFPEGISIGEDFVFLAKALGRCRRAYCIEKAYYHWYRRADSAIGDENGTCIDDRALSEIRALERVVKICRSASPEVYYSACRRFFGLLMSKLKVSELNNDEESSKLICEKMSELIKGYPYKNVHDHFRVGKARFILLLKSLGADKQLILFIMERFSAKKS